MKRMWGIVSVIFAGFILLASGNAHALDTSNFTIQSFDADYYLSKNDKNVSTMRVEETITAVFPSYNQNHGILRAIPETYKGNSVKVNVLTITDENGITYPYSTSSSNGNLVLKIGSANTYVHGAITICKMFCKSASNTIR